jgi:uncharacterized protein (TIGR02246 family)
MNTQKLILTAALGLAMTGAYGEAPSATAAWAAAVNSGDRAALALLYTDDAVMVSPASEIISAPEAISDYWTSQRLSGASDFRVLSVNERVDGDTLYQSAVWATSYRSNGRISALDGQMTNVLVRQPDGSWKIRLQSWN